MFKREREAQVELNKTEANNTWEVSKTVASKAAVGQVVHVPRQLACLECHTCCSSVGDSPAEPIVGIVTRLAQGRVFLTKVPFNIIPCY
jgi:hypothetical protein